MNFSFFNLFFLKKNINVELTMLQVLSSQMGDGDLSFIYKKIELELM